MTVSSHDFSKFYDYWSSKFLNENIVLLKKKQRVGIFVVIVVLFVLNNHLKN